MLSMKFHSLHISSLLLNVPNSGLWRFEEGRVDELMFKGRKLTKLVLDVGIVGELSCMVSSCHVHPLQNCFAFKVAEGRVDGGWCCTNHEALSPHNIRRHQLVKQDFESFPKGIHKAKWIFGTCQTELCQVGPQVCHVNKHSSEHPRI